MGVTKASTLVRASSFVSHMEAPFQIVGLPCRRAIRRWISHLRSVWMERARGDVKLRNCVRMALALLLIGAVHSLVPAHAEDALQAPAATAASKQSETHSDLQNRELRSQEAMAFWAMASFWLALGSALATVAALVAVIRTLHHTRRSADYAQTMAEHSSRATDAALKSVALSEEHGRASLRAYLTLEGAVRPKDTPDGFLLVKLTLRNCGQTPAKILETNEFTALINGPIGQDLATMDLIAKPHKIVVGAGAATAIFSGNTTNRVDGLKAAIETGRVSIFSRIEVTYEDIFGVSHKSSFVRVSTGGVKIEADMAVHPDFPDQLA